MTARRRPSEPPPLEIREFTPEEIQRGVAKLKRRIEEAKALAADKVRFNDQRIRNVEHAIRDTILEVFGGNSPEYRAHQYHDISHGGSYINMPDSLKSKGVLRPASHKQLPCWRV